MERQHIRYRSVTPPEFSWGDASMQGLRYRLPLPVFYRTYSALFCVVRLPKALPWADILRSLLSAPHSELRFRAIV